MNNWDSILKEGFLVNECKDEVAFLDRSTCLSCLFEESHCPNSTRDSLHIFTRDLKSAKLDIFNFRKEDPLGIFVVLPGSQFMSE